MINWNTINTVFLDMDGTLLDLHYDNYIWLEAMPNEYAKKHNVTIKAAKQYIRKQIDKYAGGLDAYCFDHWEKILQIDIMKLHQQEQHRVRYRHDAEYFLKQLKRMSCNVVILTNAYPENLNLKISITQLNNYVGNIYTSHQYGYSKEQMKFWKAIHGEISFNPEKSIFIDDSVANLRAAKKYGIKYLYAIAKPCSQSEKIITNEFDAIENFSELFNENLI